MTIGCVINPGHEQSEKVEDCHGEREQSESMLLCCRLIIQLFKFMCFLVNLHFVTYNVNVKTEF